MKNLIGTMLFFIFKKYNILAFSIILICLYPVTIYSQSHYNDDPFFKANMAFRGFFSDARAQLVEEQGPFVLLIGDNLILLHENKRDTQRVSLPLYHDLKTVAHIPFGAYVCLMYESDGPLSLEKEIQLFDYKKLTEDVLNQLPSRRIPKEFISNQEELLNGTIKYIEEILQSKKVNREALLSFVRRNRNKMDLNTEQAAKVQLDAMLIVMNNWFSTMTEEEQMSTRAIISGRKCCRKRDMASLFFSKYLREPIDGSRVFFVEEIFEPERMLTTLGTYLISEQAGQDVFQNPFRLHEDVLGQFAEKYLLKMKF